MWGDVGRRGEIAACRDSSSATSPRTSAAHLGCTPRLRTLYTPLHRQHTSGYTHCTASAAPPPRRALDLLDESRAAGAPADVLSYGNAMSACARNGRVGNVLQLLDKMRADGLQPNAFCYNSALIACTRASRLPQVLRPGIVSHGSRESPSPLRASRPPHGPFLDLS